MGNGNRAAQKRERNQKDQKSTAKSQLKTNVAAMDIQCAICKQTFLKTSKAPTLTIHAENKHSKTLADCFPGFEAAS